MTSKEALQQLNNFISREKHINSERNKIVSECINTIKQDLNFLEWLKGDNKKQVELVGKLLEKNEKLKKAIEILKMHNLTISYIPEITRPHLCLNDYGDGVTLDINEYELLKEVFDNEI